MDGILRALGFDSKPEFKDKIPDTLTKDCFNLHNTFKHGFSSQPICLGYDSVQQLLAIGTENGAVLLLGKPGLERHIEHPSKVGVTHLEFITNKGLLVTACDNNTLYLWNLKEKEPSIIHSLELVTEKPTALSYVFSSEWMYIGTDAGNVHILHLYTFKLSGFTIYWNNAVELSCRHKPGDVISLQEHPLDQGKVLIAFSGGKCVLFDMKARSEGGAQRDPRGEAHKRFNYDPGSDHILTCVSWLGNGKNFACSYSDGTIVMWNPKSEARPERIFPLHDIDPLAFKPIYKMQQIHTESEPWIVATGGYPEGSDLAPRTLTIARGKNTPRMLSSENTILDFICLPSSPYASDCQRPFSLVILTKSELILHDLEQPEYPRYPTYLLPYALDIHSPTVTFLHYCADCPEEFIASLHSVKSKLMKTSAKPWPLKGGKWGQEVPHTSTDLLITGHVDGSVRLWYCSSVILQPFFTLNTSQYFKMQYQPSPTHPSTSPTSPPAGSTPSSSKAPPPARPPPPTRPPQSKVLSQVSCPTGNSIHSPVDVPALSTSLEALNVINEEAEESSKVTSPHAAPGQQERGSPSDSIDGGNIEPDAERTQTPERKLVHSHEKKSIFKKKKKGSTESPHSSRGSTPNPDEREIDRLTPTQGRLQVSNKKKSGSFRKSFSKVAKAVKISRSFSKQKSRKERNPVEDVDGELSSGGSGSTPSLEDSREDVSPSPKRPDTIPLREQSSPTVVLTPNGDESKQATSTPAYHGSTSKTPGSTNKSEVLLAQTTDLSPPSSPKPPPNKQVKTQTPKATKSVKLPEEVERGSDSSVASAVSPPLQSAQNEDFFPIANIHMDVHGLWMCVSNKGGTVLAFNFHRSEQDKLPQAIEINFDVDSVRRQYAPSSSRIKSPATPSLPVGQWVFTTKPSDSHPGFHLCQVCTCYYHTEPKKRRGRKEQQTQVPVKISVMKYSVDLGLLAVGTNRGIALVNTGTNTCLYVLSCLTSILYMSDPSKFTRQIRKESQMELPSPKPLVQRHSTTYALSAVASPPSSPFGVPKSARASSSPHLALSPLPETDELEDDTFIDQNGMMVSELPCSVTSLELVQLQLDKQVPPTLTLWAGLASGHLVAYGINIVRQAEGKRKVELLPTKFIHETKGPIVNLYFLNEWGDCQVIPYQLHRTNLAGSPERETAARPRTTALEHYAIVVNEDKIRSFMCPGFNKVDSCTLPLTDGSAILQSEYFTCNDLPCLLSMASNKTLFVHSLPGLKELLHVPFNALTDTRSLCTFHVSGHGYGIYMSSDSEIQRLSVVKEDKLNLPACLPDLHVRMADPEPYHGGMGKRILDALFTGTPATVNREHIFGEAARRPVGNLYKLDGRVGTAYAGQRDVEKEEHRVGATGARREGHHAAKGKSGVAGQMERNVHALHERQEKLSAIEQRTEEVAQQASDFAALAKKLRQKYE